MRRVQVGPGSNSYTPKMDSGKFAPAASTAGYRRVNQASGPQASKGEYVSVGWRGGQVWGRCGDAPPTLGVWEGADGERGLEGRER